MKIRILMLSLIGVIFFNSCSSDSNSSDSNSTNSTSQNLDPNTILPKKVIISFFDGLFNEYREWTYEFFYNQNKIDYIKWTFQDGLGNSSVIDIFFTYSGDFITQISYGGDNEYFYYQNNQLTQSDNFYTTDYTYNSNGTINTTNTSTNEFITYTLTNGLITSSSSGDNLTYSSSTFSPYKNITGIEKIFLFPNASSLKDLFLYPKNIGREKLTSGNSSGDYSYVYTYNNILFPTSIVVYNTGLFFTFRRSINITYY
jgi:hypothetical protein